MKLNEANFIYSYSCLGQLVLFQTKRMEKIDLRYLDKINTNDAYLYPGLERV